MDEDEEEEVRLAIFSPGPVPSAHFML
jgi:hypothetical protein